MDFLEKDLEEILFTADRRLLVERGLLIQGRIKRQLRIGNYGIADLVTFNRISKNKNDYGDSFLNITVYELKKENITVSAFLQALGYVRGIDSYLKKRNFKFDYYFRIVLIGKKLDQKSTFSFLPEYYQKLKIYTYQYNINGLRFNKEYGYNLIEEGFNNE